MSVAASHLGRLIKAAPECRPTGHATGPANFRASSAAFEARHLASSPSLLSQPSAQQSEGHTVTSGSLRFRSRAVTSCSVSHVFRPLFWLTRTAHCTHDEAARVMTPSTDELRPLKQRPCFSQEWAAMASASTQGGQAWQDGAAAVVCPRWLSPKRRLTAFTPGLC